MASSSFEGHSYKSPSSLSMKNRYCKCNRKATLRISESERNPNKLYFSCSKCNYFQWYEGNEGEELQRQRNEGEEVQRTRNGADSAVLPLRKANQECNFVPQQNACITFLFIINLVLLAIYLFIQIVKAITVSCSSNSRCVPSCLALTGHA